MTPDLTTIENATFPSKITSIDEVITTLDDIILECSLEANPLGYFAALYQKVTIKVKEGIANNFFDDGPRMEQLDIVFAERYLNAYKAYQNNNPLTSSWKKAFDFSHQYWPIVFQHLLMGINAHINLDLGIAAAKISEGKPIDELENDFNKINEILFSLVDEVQNKLSKIWPGLKFILRYTGKTDDFLVNFGMSIARNGAWTFAKSLVGKSSEEIQTLIESRDQQVFQQANIIASPGLLFKILLGIIRISERGSIHQRIKHLKNI